jgi:hypothetical protein
MLGNKESITLYIPIAYNIFYAVVNSKIKIFWYSQLIMGTAGGTYLKIRDIEIYAFIHISIMKDTDISYIKTDENIIINEKAIRWVRKMEDCLYVCTKQTGCTFMDTIKICKVNNIDSYNKLNKHFD